MKWHRGRNEGCGRGCGEAVPEIFFPTPFPFAHFLPALPEAVLQSQGKLQAQTWRELRLKQHGWSWSHGLKNSSICWSTSDCELSTLWRGQGDNPNQSPRVKQKKLFIFHRAYLCIYLLLKSISEFTGEMACIFFSAGNITSAWTKQYFSQNRSRESWKTTNLLTTLTYMI